MTDEEIEVVAEELAKSDGLSRYPGPVQGPRMGLVSPHILSRPESFQIRRLHIGKLNAKLVRAQTLRRPEMEEVKGHGGIQPTKVSQPVNAQRPL